MQTEKPLQKEFDYYQSTKAELLKDKIGKFALIKGDKLISTFDTDADAYKAGLLEFGNVPFLVIQIVPNNDKSWIPILELGLLNAD